MTTAGKSWGIDLLGWKLRSANAFPGGMTLLLTDETGRTHGLSLGETGARLLMHEVAMGDPAALHEALEFRLVRMIAGAVEDKRGSEDL